MTRRQLAVNLLSKVAAIGLWFFHPWWAAALFFGPSFYLLYHLFVPSAQGLVPVVTHFQTPRRELWLTIDDGPDPADTPRILDLLDLHQARATFFVIGERARRCPELIAEIIRRGHDLGHHSDSHPVGTFWCLPPARLKRELDQGLAVLRAAGAPNRWFRPPVGIKNLFLRRALAERGLVCVGWSARGWDCASREPNQVVARIVRRVRPGAIILLHEGAGVPRAVRIVAISRVLEDLTAQGYVFVVPTPAEVG